MAENVILVRAFGFPQDKESDKNFKHLNSVKLIFALDVIFIELVKIRRKSLTLRQAAIFGILRSTNDV